MIFYSPFGIIYLMVGGLGKNTNSVKPLLPLLNCSNVVFFCQKPTEMLKGRLYYFFEHQGQTWGLTRKPF